MHVKILSENNYLEALFGIGLSHGLTSELSFEQFKELPELQERIHGVAVKLAPKGNGHNKFLYQMGITLDLDLPRYMWPEFDQYKVATVTQSESTMHTITKHEFTQDMFEGGNVPHVVLFYLNELRNEYLKTKDKTVWKKIIETKPESLLQRRIWTGNYANLRNIIAQRTGHKLSEWAIFIDAIKSQAQHPELLDV